MENQEYDISTLHELGIIINSKQQNLDHLLVPRPPDVCMCKYCNSGRLVEKFQAIANEMNEKLTGEMVQLTDRAEQITAEAGEKKIEFKGLGTFIFNKDKQKIIDDSFMSQPEEWKRQFAESNPDLFIKKETIAPNKKEITNRIKNGEIIEGFSLSGESYTFKFKS